MAGVDNGQTEIGGIKAEAGNRARDMALRRDNEGCRGMGILVVFAIIGRNGIRRLWRVRRPSRPAAKEIGLRGKFTVGADLRLFHRTGVCRGIFWVETDHDQPKVRSRPPLD